MLTTLVLLVATQTSCRPGVVSDGGVAVLSTDLDGDRVPDELRMLDREVEVRFSSKRAPFKRALTWEMFGGLEVHLGKVPSFSGEGREEALRFIEDRIYGETCDSPDPTLRRLRQQRSKRTPLNWIAGPVQLPDPYLLREKDSWLVYRWFCYSPVTGVNASPPKEVASEGQFVVLKTCHAVVLRDLENDRFAWLYVIDHPIDKLRNASIGDVTMADGGVTIELRLPSVEAPAFYEVTVRIDDGSIRHLQGKR